MPVLDNTDFIDVFLQKNATFRGGVFGNDAHVFFERCLTRAGYMYNSERSVRSRALSRPTVDSEMFAIYTVHTTRPDAEKNCLVARRLVASLGTV